MMFTVLTDRQADYLRLHCAGRGAVQIAEAMGLSPRQVRGLLVAVVRRTRAASIEGVCRMVEAGDGPTA